MSMGEGVPELFVSILNFFISKKPTFFLRDFPPGLEKAQNSDLIERNSINDWFFDYGGCRKLCVSRLGNHMAFSCERDGFLVFGWNGVLIQ